MAPLFETLADSFDGDTLDAEKWYEYSPHPEEVVPVVADGAVALTQLLEFTGTTARLATVDYYAIADSSVIVNLDFPTRGDGSYASIGVGELGTGLLTVGVYAHYPTPGGFLLVWKNAADVLQSSAVAVDPDVYTWIRLRDGGDGIMHLDLSEGGSDWTDSANTGVPTYQYDRVEGWQLELAAHLENVDDTVRYLQVGEAGWYPLRADFTDGTPNESVHPDHHNDLATAVNELDGRVGTLEGAGGGGGGVTQTDITATGAGTYTLPESGDLFVVEVQGPGGGGGSGRRGAAGTTRCGGGGGGGGARAYATFTRAALLAAYPTGEIPYQVGVGGAGGAARTTDDTSGLNGATTTSANWTLFGTNGNLLQARGGSGGSGGATSSNSNGGGGWTGMFNGGNGANGNQGAGNNASGSAGAAGGGGGGGLAADIAWNGGAGGQPYMHNVAVGAGGDAVGAGPTAGGPMPDLLPGVGAGGGAASTTGAAQAGANALPNSGAGGGGGGASVNGNASGAGGAGGSGYIRITVS
jgi:hypothetical protein